MTRPDYCPVAQEPCQAMCAMSDVRCKIRDSRPQPAAPDDELTQVLIERDETEAIADELAAKIAEITGDDIGEHTSGNCPWRKALEVADDWVNRPQPAAQWVEVECPLCGDMAVAHTHPVLKKPAAQWVGLTDEEFCHLFEEYHDCYGQPINANDNGWAYERAIETKLRERNT